MTDFLSFIIFPMVEVYIMFKTYGEIEKRNYKNEKNTRVIGDYFALNLRFSVTHGIPIVVMYCVILYLLGWA